MKVLLVAGHGKGAYSNDPGVVNTELDICERDFVRQKSFLMLLSILNKQK